jgi:hypothetical protein
MMMMASLWRTFGTLGLFLLLGPALRAADGPDPRAVNIHLQRAPAEKTEPYRRIRPESTYSIVVYGDDMVRYKGQNDPAYRLFGFDRYFSFAELKEVLTAFYRDFPLEPEKDGKFRGDIPFPNIIYIPGGWNERTQDGPNLVDALAQQYGIALFYCLFQSYNTQIKEEGVYDFPQACRDFYFERLSKAVKAVKAPEAKRPETK